MTVSTPSNMVLAQSDQVTRFPAGEPVRALDDSLNVRQLGRESRRPTPPLAKNDTIEQCDHTHGFLRSYLKSSST